MKIIVTFISLFFACFAIGQRCAPLANNGNVSTIASTNSNARIVSGRDTLNNEVIIIPVVVHILYNTNEQNISDQQVLSQIDVLNKDYRRLNADAVNTPMAFKNVAADVRISFCLAKTDPEGKPTTGILRKFTSVSSFKTNDVMKFSAQGGDNAWDAGSYLNLWVCNLSGNMLGYAVLPGTPAERDGVVIHYTAFGTVGKIKAPYNKGRTATHEIGHWLGLQHLWGDADCGDDGISDTPPQQKANTGCTSFPHISSCSSNPSGDMFMNFMDLTDDACMNLFTEGQKSRMRSFFAKGNLRNSFLQATACTATIEEAGPLPDSNSDSQKVIISVYPNPFNSGVTIDLGNASQITGKLIKVFNTTGQLIASQPVTSRKTLLQLGNLPPGVYILKIAGDKSNAVYKLLKGK
jgi:Pregnancy-associated plasma protein-A/Secretion system C-terminal sorting domain